jgi:hypothetical protein
VGINHTALAMHPVMHEFDLWLREASEQMALKTVDFTEEAEKNEVESALDEALLSTLKKMAHGAGSQRKKSRPTWFFTTPHSKSLPPAAHRPLRHSWQ